MTAAPKLTKLRWPQRERLRFCEQRLYWVGQIQRTDLCQTFGISVPAASKDFSDLLKIHGKTLAYSAKLRYYAPTADFKPALGEPDLDYILSLLGRSQQGAAGGPLVAHLALPTRSFKPEVARALVRAVNERQSIGIRYSSASPDSKVADFRWITPTAFGHDGYRWHVRSYCHMRQDYRDFVLGRIEEVTAPAPSPTIPEDKDWAETTDFVFVPQSQDPATLRSLALDFGAMPIQVTERRAFGRYLDHQLAVVKLKQGKAPRKSSGS